LVVARDEVERERLRGIESRAVRNGVPGVRWLDGAALREIEPGVAGVAALHSPTTAIVDYPGVARALAGEIRRHGGRVLLGAPVTAIRPGATVTVRAGESEHRLDQLVLCAGLQSDLVARMAGAGPGVPVPRRALHPAGGRHRRHRAERGAGRGPGGLPAPGRGAGRAGRD